MSTFVENLKKPDTYVNALLLLIAGAGSAIGVLTIDAGYQLVTNAEQLASMITLQEAKELVWVAVGGVASMIGVFVLDVALRAGAAAIIRISENGEGDA